MQCFVSPVGTKESGKDFSSFRGLPLCCSDKMQTSSKATHVIYLHVPHLRAQEDQNLFSKYPAKEITSSVVLIDRPLFEGEWLKLSTTDFDFSIKTIGEESNIPQRIGLGGSILLLEKNDYDRKDCEDKICILYEAFEEVPVGRDVTTGEIVARCTKTVLATALEMQESGALAVILVLPEVLKAEGFRRSGELPELAKFPFGIMEHDHGSYLRDHVAKLLANSQDIIREAEEWEEHHEPFTGVPFYQNKKTSEKRRFRPVFSPKLRSLLLDIKVDLFVPHLSNIVSNMSKPKGVIICQRSWRPDCEFVDLVGTEFQNLQVPLVLLSYEDGEEFKELAQTRAKDLHVTIEEHKTGAIYAWGNGTQGQLGLHKILNVDPFEHSVNPLTGEANIYVPRPVYLSHLHGEGIVDLSCGFAHTIACTKRNEVFSWGAADGLGVQSKKRHDGSSVPILVEQFENLVYVNQVYAGSNHSFAICDMPFRSVLGTGR